MVINKDHKLFNKVVVKDLTGQAITMLKSFDTTTQLAEIWLLTRQDADRSSVIVIEDLQNPGKREAAIAKVVLPGCKLYYRDTGKLVPEEDL